MTKSIFWGSILWYLGRLARTTQVVSHLNSKDHPAHRLLLLNTGLHESYSGHTLYRTPFYSRSIPIKCVLLHPLSWMDVRWEDKLLSATIPVLLWQECSSTPDYMGWFSASFQLFYRVQWVTMALEPSQAPPNKTVNKISPRYCREQKSQYLFRHTNCYRTLETLATPAGLSSSDILV